MILLLSDRKKGTRMARSDSIKNLAVALAASQGEFSAVPKGADNPFFKSKYAALPDVIATATPVLAKNGLSVAQFVDSDEHGDLLTTYLLHVSGEFISHSMRLHVAKANDPQSQGSAITYARRYSYMSALGLVADIDDDGNAASNNSAQSSYQPNLNQRVAQAATASPSNNAGGEGASSDNQRKAIWAISHRGLNWNDLQMYTKLEEVLGRKIEGLETLTMSEAKKAIEVLKSIQENQ
jgi:hypothetical protein